MMKEGVLSFMYKSCDYISQPLIKKHKNVRYRRWDQSFTDSLPLEPGVPDKEIQNVSHWLRQSLCSNST